MPVDDQPREVLQGGEAVGLVHGTLQFQHHRCALNALMGVLGGGLLLQLPLIRLVLWAHVVLHQAGHVGEGGEAGPGRGAGVQQKLGAAVLDAYAGGTAGGPDRQGQHVERVAAVPDQESPFRSLLQGSVGLSCCYGSPVPSCSDRPPLAGSVQADLTRTRTECTRKTALLLLFLFVWLFFLCHTCIFQVAKVAGDRPEVLGGIPGWMGALKARVGGHRSCPHAPWGLSGRSSRQRSGTGRKKKNLLLLIKGMKRGK